MKLLLRHLPAAQLSLWLARYGLVLILAWVGSLKFLDYEAQGIRTLVAHSFLMRWMYTIWDTHTTAAVIGVTELVTALLLACYRWWPRASAVGSLLAMLIFMTTLSFMLTTPGIVAKGYSSLALSGGGQSLLKDLLLFAAALLTFAEVQQRLGTQPNKTVI